MQRRIIDKRKKEKFMVDDAYFNGQARICGWQATLVYPLLCRHANLDQECFPSIKLMQEKLAVSRNTIIKGLENLSGHKVITIIKKRDKKGKWQNNVYILLDKSEWLRTQVPVKDMDTQVPVKTNPCPCGDKPKSLSGTIRKHIEGNTYKDSNNLKILPKEKRNENLKRLASMKDKFLGGSL